MRIDRLYRISAFGEFLNITPTAENMLFLLEEFKEYGLVPSLFQEMKVENIALSPAPLQRIAMVSTDHNNSYNERIAIGSNRIDFEYSITTDRELSNEDKEKINKKACHIFGVIFKKYDKKSSRLALNTESLLAGLSDVEVLDFMSRYTNPISLYDSKSLGEWGTRLMVREKNNISDKEEFFNIITVIGKIILSKQSNGNVTHNNGFNVNIDINTIAENSSVRFISSDIDDFIKTSTKWWNIIISEVSGNDK